MKRIALIVAALALGMAASAQVYDYPFQNPDLPREERIDDLLSRLTLEEKVGMMMNSARGVERLGIPAYNWWNEALHGVARAGLATVFPQAIGLAATFDPETQYETFSIVSDEARAKYHQALREGMHAQYYGLTFWTPNINIFRDPRWGRGQETYGEDPYLTSQMGLATVRGLQGDDPDYFKAHACAKHFAVHSGPESTRHKFDARVSQTDLWETYLPAFKALVTEGNVQEVMGAYNRYEGDPCCGSERLLGDILREKWGYTGLVVSDCGAINDFYNETAHAVYPDAQVSSAVAVKTGTDLECGGCYSSLPAAVLAGQITEAEIDVSVRRLLKSRFELGMFDPDERVPYASIPYDVVDSDAHKAQALKEARESIVLMKNAGVLPLKPQNVKKIAVIGPNADDESMLMGNYNGTPSSSVTILQSIKDAYPEAEVTYERGCDLVEGWVHVDRTINPAEVEEWMGIPAGSLNSRSLNRGGFDADFMKKLDEFRAAQELKAPKPIPAEAYTPEALAELASRAADADVIVFVGGLAPTLEGEQMRVDLEGFLGGDRLTIELPEIQSRVLKALHATGTPVVFVMCTGSAIGLEANESDYDALVNAWYGGQAAGTAVAEVLSGAVNPSGKLPVTFYKSTAQLPDFENYDMAGRTYRYMKEQPLYSFGFGLSYTKFVLRGARLSARKASAGESVTVKVKVRNAGKMDGDEVVQVYVQRLDDPSAPVKSLKGFKRVSVSSGSSKAVSIELPASAFEYYDEAVDGLSVKSGKYRILVGNSSCDKSLKALKFKLI